MYGVDILILNTFLGSVSSKDITCGENDCDIDRTHCPVIATDALTTVEGTVLYNRLHQIKPFFYYRHWSSGALLYQQLPWLCFNLIGQFINKDT